MSSRITIDALRSLLGGEMLERANSGRGGLLIETAGLGLVGDILKRIPKDRAEDVFLVSPENERCVGLLPVGSAERLIAVLNALNPTLALKQFELAALRIFASYTPDSTAARAIDIRPTNVKNRALALLFRLIEELNSPTWDCARDEPHALHELTANGLQSSVVSQRPRRYRSHRSYWTHLSNSEGSRYHRNRDSRQAAARV